MLKDKLKMNLQYFAEDVEEESTEEEETEITLPTNQSELDALINKSNQKAIENAKKGLFTEEQVQEMVQNEISKQKEYADLSEDEREKREFEEEKTAFEEQRIEFEHEKLLTEVKADLVDKGLPASFAEVLAIKGDNEKSFEMVKTFETEWKQALAEQRKEDFKQSPPNVGGSNNTQTSYGARLGASKKKTTQKIFD